MRVEVSCLSMEVDSAGESKFCNIFFLCFEMRSFIFKNNSYYLLLNNNFSLFYVSFKIEIFSYKNNHPMKPF